MSLILIIVLFDYSLRRRRWILRAQLLWRPRSRAAFSASF